MCSGPHLRSDEILDELETSARGCVVAIQDSLPSKRAEKGCVVADHRGVDVLRQTLPLSFGLFPIGLQATALFSFRWQLVELPVARTPTPALHEEYSRL